MNEKNGQTGKIICLGSGTGKSKLAGSRLVQSRAVRRFDRRPGVGKIYAEEKAWCTSENHRKVFPRMVCSEKKPYLNRLGP